VIGGKIKQAQTKQKAEGGKKKGINAADVQIQLSG